MSDRRSETAAAAATAAAVLDALLGAGYDSVEWTMAHIDELLAPASALACQDASEMVQRFGELGRRKFGRAG